MAGHVSFGQDTLWVVSGSWVSGLDTLSGLRFEESPTWTGINAVIDRPADEASSVWVINTDSVNHVLTLDGAEMEPVILTSGTPVMVALPDLPFGSYRYHLTGERGIVLGASGLLRIGMEDDNHFHWNLSDWEPSLTHSAASGDAIDWSAPYIPRYFTINEQSYPATLDDAAAYIALTLGEACYISISNHGLMDHVLHFHGFHFEMISATQHPERIGWIKDTVPILRGESVTLHLVANQPGIYPVHNHNLIAVTNAGFYPGGMLTHIFVSP